MSSGLEREGPLRIQPVLRTYLSCSLCRHFINQMQRSGRNPVYHTFCAHPKARYSEFGYAQGRMISSNSGTETPAWCPVKKETD